MTAKSVNAGELRTHVIVQSVTKTPDGSGNFTQAWANVFTSGVSVGSKWTYAHGIEATENKRLGLGKKAALIMRYSPLITETCRILRGTETWEIESVDNIGYGNAWIEVKIKQTEAAI